MTNFFDCIASRVLHFHSGYPGLVFGASGRGSTCRGPIRAGVRGAGIATQHPRIQSSQAGIGLPDRKSPGCRPFLRGSDHGRGVTPPNKHRDNRHQARSPKIPQALSSSHMRMVWNSLPPSLPDKTNPRPQVRDRAAVHRQPEGEAVTEGQRQRQRRRQRREGQGR